MSPDYDQRVEGSTFKDLIANHLRYIHILQPFLDVQEFASSAIDSSHVSALKALSTIAPSAAIIRKIGPGAARVSVMILKTGLSIRLSILC